MDLTLETADAVMMTRRRIRNGYVTVMTLIVTLDGRKKMSVVYECAKCGAREVKEQWERSGPGSFKCPFCGYRVAKKIRAPVVKRVKAV